MAYSTSNPPQCISPNHTGPALWAYSSADAETAFDDSDYITNAEDLGMKTGDAVLILDTTNSLTTLAQVTVDADGNGTLSALTAIT